MSDFAFCPWRGLITAVQATKPFDLQAHIASFDISPRELYGPGLEATLDRPARPQGKLGSAPLVRARQAPGAPGRWRAELAVKKRRS
jgi:hypothetical protein